MILQAVKFLLISQRAKGNPGFSLKDTPGHGRIDVVVRCILAATRKVTQNSPINDSEIYAYLKGSEPTGWLHVSSGVDLGDESSAAAYIKDNWDNYWTEGGLGNLLQRFSEESIFIELTEDGSSISTFLEFVDPADIPRMVLILGAQRDLTDEDKRDLQSHIPVVHRVSLSSKSLLASQAITLFRLKVHQW